MKNLNTCLWFDGNAEDAANFYVSVFKGAKIVDTLRYGDAGPGPKGAVLTVTVEIAGHEIIAMNGGPNFKFTPAISLFAVCKDQPEVDDYWEKLSAGGKIMQCGWLTDKFGVTWQIVPDGLMEMHQDKNPKKAAAVMQAMMEMKKLDISALKHAYEAA
ncbi:MAG TPA: VOC family protein [Xanthobacteraceae bacterium]|nr:VOC family protein [Xanthobacteraceae bacterium]